MENKKRGLKKDYYWIMIIILMIMLVDQIIKIYVVSQIKGSSIQIIKGIMNFTYIENTGGAFGVGEGNLPMFLITNIVVLGIVIRFMILQKDRLDRKTKFALSLILAGGISNLLDRIFRGFVIDFIDITPILNFPKFNVADICIIIGWLLFALIMAIYTGKEIQNKNKEG